MHDYGAEKARLTVASRYKLILAVLKVCGPTSRSKLYSIMNHVSGPFDDPPVVMATLYSAGFVFRILNEYHLKDESVISKVEAEAVLKENGIECQ